MPLVDQPFYDTFIFSRGCAARYRDADGVWQLAAKNIPRFDHDATGAPLGLLVEGRPDEWRPDRLRVLDGDWALDAGTVLHIFETPQGDMRRNAWYTPFDPKAAIDACLGAKGWHRLIAYVPGYLRNRGGYVRWARQDYALGGVLLSEPGIAIGAADTIPLLEG